MKQVADIPKKSTLRGDHALYSASAAGTPMIVQIPIERVRVCGSPRAAGENHLHVQSLTEVVDSLPPIVVHRQTMMVVDGVHRLRAAQCIGANVIDAVYFDGDAREAFVAAVRMNSAHGLPLSLSDRRAAADRILHDYPEWSNRRVARVVGLSDKTVAVIRRGVAAENPHWPAERVGSDGVSRPIEAGDRRRQVLEFLEVNPGAPAQAAASATGASLSTVKRAQRQIREDSATVARPGGGAEVSTRTGDVHCVAVPDRQSERRRGLRDSSAMIRQLRADPSLRFTEQGRRLLRMLDIVPLEPTTWDSIADSLPMHCAELVVELARQHSQSWQDLANSLARRADRNSFVPD
ncbi:ParB/RepB/Spo0J family partition protein [Nocardia vaccinii]|uniref:ParB/RepB/Spo0J family partition protein n=1 Tax=Nocardia vaccinii TaxID=1822 RepID=UPI000A0219FB|nr:ParB/RepB/Spo0J family partition protein [Nocardia vaccinii]